MNKNKIMGLLCSSIATAIALAVNASLAHGGVLWTADWHPEKPNIITGTTAEGSNDLKLSDEALFNGDGAQKTIATRLTVGQPFHGSGDTFTQQNYSLRLTLTDAASHESADLLFAGDLSGTVTPAGSAVTNKFHLPESRTVTLGDYEYEVTIGPFAPNATGADAGVIYATVEVSPADGETENPQPNAAPEPTSLLLASLGAAGSGWLAWYRRRAQRG